MSLPKQSEALELVDFIENKESFKLTYETLIAWKKMKNAAYNDGITIVLVSAFRSIERQRELVEEKRKKNISDKEIFNVLAHPGYSEHHTGRALDIHTPDSALLEEDFEHTDAFRWMKKNAKKYGFFMSYPRDNKYGMIYEPWHWCLNID